MNNRIYCGHLARKRFGQNFLNDQSIINNIILAIDPQKNHRMVEIGPGLAALTKPMYELVNQLTVIELDKNLVTRLKMDTFFGPKLTIYQQNAITTNFSSLSKKLGQPIRIFGNLPYNISTRLIFHLFNHINSIYDMHFMLQKEVANRLIAKPGSKEYGRLSIIAQYYCQIIFVLAVPPSSFTPSPKVDSAVIRLIPHAKTLYSVKELHVLNHVVKEAFSKRRKMIRKSLSKLFTIKELSELEINPNMRAEDISIIQYSQMANYISNSNKLPTF